VTVHIVEVAPRDGLQNEAVTVPTARKVELIGRAVALGLRRVEAVAFVHPGRVPQMADAEAVMAALPRPAGVSYVGLVLNRRGLDRALAAGVHEVNVVVVATDTFCQRNQGVGTAAMIERARLIRDDAAAAGLGVTVTVAAAFGCPFEGDVPVERVRWILGEVAGDGLAEIALADTIGAGVPAQVRALARVARAELPGVPTRWHFHDTRNTGYANAFAAVAAGASALDASLGGLGGCPFAPAATGNIATEDLAWMLHRDGVPSGVDLAGAVRAGRYAAGLVGREPAAALPRAGLFPPTRTDR
jgi:hydroxymethylglutaryl-CoA lyase